MKTNYSKRALTILHEAYLMDETSELPILFKPSPTGTPGCLDPYERACLKQNWVAASPANPPNLPLTVAEEVANRRNAMGFPNLCLNRVEMVTHFETLSAGTDSFGLWRYEKRRTAGANRPALLYIHGGGFLGGTVYCVENACKLIAELADAVVFNVDYALAPEKKYPAGLNDCYAALEHIYTHAADYGIDPAKIAVGGDSAGGNLAAALALNCRDKGRPMIAAQLLLYPCVFLADAAHPDYQWSQSLYSIVPKMERQILPLLHLGQVTPPEQDFTMQMYLETPEQRFDPYVSPMLAQDFSNLPKALIATAEYDGLRIQGEFYGKLLHNGGTEVKILRYRGCTHAFIDRLGYQPQAEDLCTELAAALNAL